MTIECNPNEWICLTHQPTEILMGAHLFHCLSQYFQMKAKSYVPSFYAILDVRAKPQTEDQDVHLGTQRFAATSQVHIIE